MGFFSGVKESFQKAVNSVEKTIEDPTRLVTKPITEPLETGIKTASKIANSDEVQGLISNAQQAIATPGGQQAIGAAATYFTGNPQFAAEAFIDRKQPQVTSGQVQNMPPSQAMGGVYTPPIVNTTSNNMLPWILGGGAIAAILILKRK